MKIALAKVRAPQPRKTWFRGLIAYSLGAGGRSNTLPDLFFGRHLRHHMLWRKTDCPRGWYAKTCHGLRHTSARAVKRPRARIV